MFYRVYAIIYPYFTSHQDRLAASEKKGEEVELSAYSYAAPIGIGLLIGLVYCAWGIIQAGSSNYFGWSRGAAVGLALLGAAAAYASLDRTMTTSNGLAYVTPIYLLAILLIGASMVIICCRFVAWFTR